MKIKSENFRQISRTVIMKYLPFDCFVYTSPLSEREIISRIAGITDIRSTIRVHIGKTNGAKLYLGSITDNTFYISRIRQN